MTEAIITAQPGSRLGELAEMYAMLKPQAEEVKNRLEEVVNAIKLELNTAAPDSHRVQLQSPALTAPLELSARTAWKLDSKKLKAEAPALYVQYAVQTTYWELRAARST